MLKPKVYAYQSVKPIWSWLHFWALAKDRSRNFKKLFPLLISKCAEWTLIRKAYYFYNTLTPLRIQASLEVWSMHGGARHNSCPSFLSLSTQSCPRGTFSCSVEAMPLRKLLLTRDKGLEPLELRTKWEADWNVSVWRFKCTHIPEMKLANGGQGSRHNQQRKQDWEENALKGQCELLGRWNEMYE